MFDRGSTGFGGKKQRRRSFFLKKNKKTDIILVANYIRTQQQSVQVVGTVKSAPLVKFLTTFLEESGASQPRLKKFFTTLKTLEAEGTGAD